MEKPENPPAFPQGEGVQQGVCSMVNMTGGMTLRDWLAGNVLPVVVSATSAGQHFPGKGYADDRPIHERMAEDAYKLADAMLVERSKA